MKQIIKDPLLTAARVGTYVVQAFLVIGMIALGIGLAVCVALAIGWVPDDMTVTGIEGGVEAMSSAGLWIGAVSIVLIMASLGLLNDFTVRLRQIIDTVGLGDPFVLDNAGRLTRMAWIAVIVQLVLLAAAVLAGMAGAQLDENVFELNVDLSPGGVVMAVILFILARVFRKGAEMRAELEGTV